MARKTIKVKYGVEMTEPRRIPPWLKMLAVLAAISLGIFAFYHFVIWILAPTEEEIRIMEATPTATPSPEPSASPSPTPTERPSPTVKPDLSYELSNAVQYGEHVKGWVYIPGIGVDTPILQWGNNEYFQEKDIFLNDTQAGSVYLDYRSDISYIMDSGNIVIYGYNNLGGRQLKNLLKYIHEDYFRSNNTVVFETLYGEYSFELFSAHIEEDDSDYVVRPESRAEKADLIALMAENSMFQVEEIPDSETVILTFSVDVESTSGSRFLVHAFLTNN